MKPTVVSADALFEEFRIHLKWEWVAGLGASERDIVKDAQREKLADKRPDPLLRESAAILGDAIEILGQDRKLSAQVLPDSPGPGRWAE